MVAYNRVNLDFVQEAPTGLNDAEEEDSNRHTGASQNTVLNARAYRDQYASEEDNHIQWRTSLVLVESIGMGDEITYGVDNNGREGCGRDVEEGYR